MRWLPIILLSAVSSAGAEEADWHWSADMGLSYFRHTNRGVGETQAWRPTVALALTSEINENWRLHSAVEWLFDNSGDEIARGNVVNWRAAEINYRLGERWALSAYGGFARYYRELPSWGYSIGYGAKYRLGERWQLSLDVTQAAVDISDSVPQSAPLRNRDYLSWSTLSLNYQF